MTCDVAWGYDRQRSVIEEYMMRKKLISLLLNTLVLVSLGTAVSGCSTIEGAGKDLEKAGEAIRDAARNANS
ncbi:entericidin A/B family lipoprotein [Marinobacterium halophilum]|nr:entericidin A/B family lipoprotein [Marinobacterium halophilum]